MSQAVLVHRILCRGVTIPNPLSNLTFSKFSKQAVRSILENRMSRPKPQIPLPKSWPIHVRAAILQVIALAQVASAYTRSWATTGVQPMSFWRRHPTTRGECDPRTLTSYGDLARSWLRTARNVVYLLAFFFLSVFTLRKTTHRPECRTTPSRSCLSLGASTSTSKSK